MRFRTRLRLACTVLAIAAGALTPWRPPSGAAENPADAPAAREPCLVFAYPQGRYMHSNQMLGIVRIVAVARRLGCRVLPLFLSEGGAGGGKRRDAWHTGTIPLGEFYAPRGDFFVDLGREDQREWVGRVLAREGVRGTGAGSPSDQDAAAFRLRLQIHQHNNDEPLSLPCVLDEHAVGDSRAVRTQPFSCRETVLLGPWATHAPPDAVPGAEALDFRRRFAGRLVGAPYPYTFNISCAAEQEASGEMPPREELLRVAKWALWNLILSPDAPGNGTHEDPADKIVRLLPPGGVPRLDDPAYDAYPVPSPLLLTAHARTSRYVAEYCNSRLRFPLCGTTESLAARFLAERLASADPGRTVAYIATDAVPGSPWGPGDLSGSLRTALDAVLPPPAPRPRIAFAHGAYPALASLLDHPSVGFDGWRAWVPDYGPLAREKHRGLAMAVLDQILLSCGDHVSRGAAGGYYQTHWSTFSWRARTIGAAVARLVCVPNGAPVPEDDGHMAPGELAAREYEARRAGVDFSARFPWRDGKPRAVLGPDRFWNLGCAARGRFLPSLGWEGRVRSRETCGECGPGRW